MTGEHLIGEVSRLVTGRDAFPAVLRCDKGLELGRRAMADWSSGQVGLHVIPPDCPWRKGHVESINSSIRDECLNGFWSATQPRMSLNDSRWS
jgi:putative transposase